MSLIETPEQKIIRENSTVRFMTNVVFDGLTDVTVTDSILSKQIDLVFDVPTYEKSFEIEDISINPNSSVVVTYIGNPTAGNDIDEVEFDKFNIVATPYTVTYPYAVAVPHNGGMTLYVAAVPGPVYGSYKFSYTIT